MHWMLTYEYVDDYLERRGPLRAEHIGLAAAAHERGELVMGGALTDPADRGILVFVGADPTVAEAFARSDPYVKEGLVTAWAVRGWNVVIGLGATPP